MRGHGLARRSSVRQTGTRRARDIVLVVPALLLALGITVGTFDPRLALVAGVVVLGWTQLVGL
jgi:ABC-type dipeptide/oligopeptide/nickel transport system permease subunit